MIPTDMEGSPSVVEGSSEQGRSGNIGAVIPPFNENGHLPEGRHLANLYEIEARFVDVFPRSMTRRDIFNGYRGRREQLHSLTRVAFEWVDGSFVTSKRDAGDLDVVTFIDGSLIDAMPAADRQQLMALAEGSQPRLMHGCHSFVVAMRPVGHPQRAWYEQVEAYWSLQWAMVKGRPDLRKGYLAVEGNK